MSQSLTVAAAQYPLDALASPGAYAAKLERWVKEVAGQGAELLVHRGLARAHGDRAGAPAEVAA